MKNATSSSRYILIVCLLLTGISAFAWQVAGKKNNKNADRTYDDRDTTKSRKQRYGKNEYQLNSDVDLNLAMRNLDSQMVTLDKQLAHLDVDIDTQVNNALANIDFKKIHEQAMAAVNNVDWKKIQEEVNVSMKQSMKEVQKAMQQAQLEMQQVDMAKIEAEVKAGLAQAKLDSIHVNIDTRAIHEQVQKSLAEAHVQMKAAQAQLKQIKALTSALQKDGLIEKDKPYRIELKDGQLIINGKTQSREVTEKYRRYFPNEDHFLINNNEGDDDQDKI
ncbi:HlyD family secretion protein [Deminuibacter soli]|uniref:OmpH family outer membrane protein n=1 Tax=Deminuibacter soli TaxID=2291815 RepID=A0A3E1NDW5_9BACT|nr:hypothetical protein [Deminuibacter soli]RFM26067.1 hypothetical protein DXN05_22355 [Deminuibacter soli]